MILLRFQFHLPQGANAVPAREEEMRHGVSQINTEVKSSGPNYAVSWPAYVIHVILTVDEITL